MIKRCKNCGQLYEEDRNPKSFGFGTYTTGYSCSYHPDEPVLVSDVSDYPYCRGARNGYVDLWRFPCCGRLQPGGEFDGKSLPPPRTPGCKVGPHEEDPDWLKKIRQSNFDYDVFLSFNSQDENTARNIFDFLSTHRLRVFFSRVSIPHLAEADYIDAIHTALDKARHMVVVSSSSIGFTKGWVRAEWSIFLNEVRSGRKTGNLVTVIVGSIPIAELPIALRASQVVVLSKEGLSEILKFVS
jgi:hypothetical protein